MIVEIILLVLFFIFGCFMYACGYLIGMKKMVEEEDEYNREFQKLIVDFVTENYVKKGESIEENKSYTKQEQDKA